MDAGEIVSNSENQVMFTSPSGMQTLGADGRGLTEIDWGESDPSGHWSGTHGQDEFVATFNSGFGSESYVTDVFSMNGDSLAHSVVPDIPGAMGVVGSTLYSLNGTGGANVDEEVRLYATDLTSPDSTKKVTSWEINPDQAEWDSSRSLHFNDGHLWYLETLTSDTGESVRLVRLEPHSGDRESTELTTYDDTFWYGADHSALGFASSHGHVWDGAMFTVAHDGTIVAADLETRTLREVGEVSDEATQATYAAVGWRDDQMAVLHFDEGGTGALEIYDLESGDRKVVVDTSPLGDLLTTRDANPSSLTLQ